jgi:hypothetical protein
VEIVSIRSTKRAKRLTIRSMAAATILGIDPGAHGRAEACLIAIAGLRRETVRG